MRTHLTVPQIKDYIIDTIIIKSKLILQKSDLDELLKKSNLSFASDLLKSDSRTILSIGMSIDCSGYCIIPRAFISL